MFIYIITGLSYGFINYLIIQNFRNKYKMLPLQHRNCLHIPLAFNCSILVLISTKRLISPSMCVSFSCDACRSSSRSMDVRAGTFIPEVPPIVDCKFFRNEIIYTCTRNEQFLHSWSSKFISVSGQGYLNKI